MVYDFTKMNIVPRGGLEFWGQYESGISANGTMYDYSGNGRNLVQATNPPVLTLSALNSQYGWYFNGSSTNALKWSGSLNLKHFFIVCSADEAAFTAFRGLLSDISAIDILIGNNSGDTFFNTSIATSYKKSDVAYTLTNQKAPVNNQFAMVEVVCGTGAGMNGIQIGDQRNLGRLWKGFVFDLLCYSTIKNDLERLRIYQYAAMRYNLWQKNSSGLDVFPFVSNKTSGSEYRQEQYASEPYSGDPKILVRGNYKNSYSLPYTSRTQAEFETAKFFHKTHGSPTHSILRDYRFYPTIDIEGRIVGPLREQGSDVSMRFNYTREFQEIA